MRIRVRGPNGVSTITLDSETATIADLRSTISEKTQLATFDLKRGYPPQSLDLDQFAPELKLADSKLGLDGEQVIAVKKDITDKLRHPLPAEVKPAPSISSSKQQTFSSATSGSSVPPKPVSTIHNIQPPAPTSSLPQKPDTDVSSDPPEIPLPQRGSTMVLRVMPDDNSCLFRAFGTAYLGADLDNMTELRDVIASTILSNPDKYNAAVLDGKEPSKYTAWIKREDSWGGYVELSVLSEHFDVEICSINVQDCRVDRFNEGASKDRIVLVYSGIHYDTVALSPSEPPHTKADLPSEFDMKLFNKADDDVLEGALTLSRELQKRKYYTDTSAFTITCGDCGWKGNGEKAVTQHAKKTGHYNFTEDDA